jgi:hypothetical protein
MDTYVLILSIIGAAILGMAWMPSFTAKTGISDSVVYVLLGVIIFSTLDVLPKADPIILQSSLL